MSIRIRLKNLWQSFQQKHPSLTEFIVFFVLSNVITVIQLVLMPILKGMLINTELADISFQVLRFGHNFGGSPYYIFDYPAGALAEGGGGGLAYFLSVQLTLAIAQIINFFAQRNVTFKSNGSIKKAAFWYVVAFLLITLGAAALQGIYKAPIYNLLINTWGMGRTGETIADVISMLINCAVSFWVYFPILKIIFKK
ncbi:MAG: hypothetical protein K0S04_3124 [Herbinix sp.]|jgi:putative flippase GtrA|nr:hypothetical protein [Herbinix sp.]